MQRACWPNIIKVTSAPEIEEAVLVAMLTRPFDKNDRETATSALSRHARTTFWNLFQRYLPQADIDTRYGLVQAAGRSGAPAILALLAERAKVEKGRQGAGCDPGNPRGRRGR